MKVTLQVIIERDDESPIVAEIASLQREMLAPETLGLTLVAAKTVLVRLQEARVTQPATAYVAQQQICPMCGARRSYKGHHPIVRRSLCGKLTLDRPCRDTCGCQPTDTSHRSSP